ncbi:MAG: nucleotidyl transferase AbiEii/AbiGii toxin family protein [Acidobacteriota bacterium]
MEILGSLQKEILNCLKDLSDIEAFYLTGGTALSAFYLKHRRSNDLDLFTTIEELITPFSLKVEETLKRKGLVIERKRSFQSFVELFASSPMEFTVLHIALDSPFRFEEPQESKDFPKLRIDSLIDISTNKLLTLFGRATLRDFIDVYFLIKEKFTKSELLQKSKIKDPGLDIYWLGVAFERIKEFSSNSSELLLLVRSCGVEELQNFFDEWRTEIYREITGGS